MASFANEFFWKYLRDFRAWASVAGLLVVALSAMVQHQLILPVWFWALIATGCAFWIAWRADKQVYLIKNAEVKCDISLADLLYRVIGDEIAVREAINMPRVDQLLSSIREKSHRRQIEVWGRKTDSTASNLNLYVMTEIPPEYWENYIIGYKELLADRRGKTINLHREIMKTVAVSPETIYSDLYFSEAQINSVWPAPQRKPKRHLPTFRMPISWTPNP